MMFSSEATVRLKEPSLVRWLSYFHAVRILIENYIVLLIELEGAWRQYKDDYAHGASATLYLLSLCVCVREQATPNGIVNVSLHSPHVILTLTVSFRLCSQAFSRSCHMFIFFRYYVSYMTPVRLSMC